MTGNVVQLIEKTYKAYKEQLQ